MHQYTEVKSVWVNVDANLPPYYPRRLNQCLNHGDTEDTEKSNCTQNDSVPAA